MFKIACRNSVKNEISDQKIFLRLPSCIAIDSFFRKAIAFVLLRICSLFFSADQVLNKVLGHRARRQDLWKDQRVLDTATVLTKTELKDDAPFVLELPIKLNNRAPILEGELA